MNKTETSSDTENKQGCQMGGGGGLIEKGEGIQQCKLAVMK